MTDIKLSPYDQFLRFVNAVGAGAFPEPIGAYFSREEGYVEIQYRQVDTRDELDWLGVTIDVEFPVEPEHSNDQWDFFRAQRDDMWFVVPVVKTVTES